MSYLSKEELLILEEIKEIGINKRFLDFLINNNVNLEVIYLCLFFTFDKPPKIAGLELDFLNGHFTDIRNICNLNIDLSLGNTYEDYRNLIIILSKDIRVLIAVLYIRLYTMQILKKVEFEDKKTYGLNTLKIYAPLAHRLGMGDIKTQLEELSLYYTDIEKFKSIVNRLESKKELRQKQVQNTIDKISKSSKGEINFEIFGRSKSIYSIYKKVYENSKGFDEIYDFQGIRIICDTKEECYTMLGKIHDIFEPLPHRFKDYILLKKPNLYQSIHTSIYDDNKNIYEIQIRTHEMDEIAEKGIAAHWIYKEGSKAKNKKDMEDSLHLFRDSIEENTLSSEENNLFKLAIYAYTPAGKILILNSGSTIIDFAYRIHSQVAEHMTGAIVNGKIENFNYKINNGDVIQINTNKNQKTVNKEWLDIAISLHAHKKIKSYLNKQKSTDQFSNQQSGKKLLEQALRNDKLRLDIINDQEIINTVTKKLSYKTVEKIYSDFYLGNISLREINSVDLNDNEDYILKRLKSSNYKETGYDIAVPGIDNIKLDFAKCCHPVYGDDVIGVIKNGKSVTIHKKGCINSQNANTLDVFWTKDNKHKYLSKLYMETIYTNKILNTIVSTLSKANIQVKKINYKVDQKSVKINLDIEIENIQKLNDLTNVLKNIGEDTYIKIV